MRASWALVGAGLALVAIATGASAIDSHVVVEAEEGPAHVEPGGPPGTWELTVTYESTTPIAEDVRVDLEPQVGSGWLDVQVEPSTITFSPDDTDPGQPPYTYTEPALLAVGAHRYAPAFVAERISISPQAQAGDIEDPAEQATHVVAIPDYRGGLAAERVASVVELEAGEEGHARAHLDSTANGASIVTVEDVEAPAGCEVEPLREEVPLARAGEDEALVHVACPAEADGATLAVTFEQAYAPDPSLETTTATARWDLHVEDPPIQTQANLAPSSSSTDEVSVAAVLGLGALATAAVVRQRRG